MELRQIGSDFEDHHEENQYHKQHHENNDKYHQNNDEVYLLDDSHIGIFDFFLLTFYLLSLFLYFRLSLTNYFYSFIFR